MKLIKRTALLLLAAVITLCLTCCAKEEAVMQDYTITLTSEGGMPLENSVIRIYAEGAADDLVWAGSTDSNGRVSYKALSGKSYIAYLSDIPEGYKTAESYKFTETDTAIALSTELRDAKDLSSLSFELGDVAGDFEVCSSDGKKLVISELLTEKKAVVLNFWYLGCDPCRMEFPFLEQAYSEFSDDLEVIAINPYDGTDESVAEFAKEYKLTFPMVAGDVNWQSCMQLTSYPTTVIIDRYGTIAMMHKGSITEKETFTDIFEYFCSDEYKQTSIRNIEDIK